MVLLRNQSCFMFPSGQRVRVIAVHVGLHKTGSSSIQLALELARNGNRSHVVTPNPTDDRTEQGWSERIKALSGSPKEPLIIRGFAASVASGHA